PPTPLLILCAISVAPGVPHFAQNPSERAATNLRVRRSVVVTFGGVGLRCCERCKPLPRVMGSVLPRPRAPGWRESPGRWVFSGVRCRREVVPCCMGFLARSGVLRWSGLPCFTHPPSCAVAVLCGGYFPARLTRFTWDSR